MTPQLKMKGDDDDVDAATAASVVNQNWDKPPERYPVITNLPIFPPLTSFDRELAERSRFLNEHFRYSGYYVMKENDQHQADKERDAPENQRYTDRYRRIPGRKTFVDEIHRPSKLLFPDELLSLSRSFRHHENADSFASRAVFLSSRSLAQHVQRLLATNKQSGAGAAATSSSSSSSSSAANEEENESGEIGGDEGGGDDEEEGGKKKKHKGAAEEGEGDEEEDDVLTEQQDEEQEDSDDAGDYGLDHWGNDEDDPQAFDDKDDSDAGEAEM